MRPDRLASGRMMLWNLNWKTAPVVAALACLHCHAVAWGEEGHRLIGDLAYERLSPDVRAKVDALLAQQPGATLGSVATWADEVRSPSTARWHYVNFERGGGCQFDRARDCPDGQCVVGAITKNVLQLSGVGPDQERLKALKWLVHLVGDVHQPFHAGFADDKGANLYQVRAYGRGSNLHSLWDSGLIGGRQGGVQVLRSEVRDRLKDQRSQADARRWAEESCEIASRPDIYPEGRFIDQAYTAKWDPVLVQRLADATSRLAGLLELSLVERPRGLAARLTSPLFNR